ncbi:MAG: DHA2 family efflux MFS transporter permease subunit [Acidobacteriota bacterium]|nr:DHA2 family efflux MFS transporter permease subunit [Acidobacteriota bacterium]
MTERPPVNKWLVTISVTFGTLMGAIDASIVNVAVPHLQGSLGATIEQITWVTTGFVMATVLVMPLTGLLARMFGQKRVYLASLFLFIIGSTLCGFAHTLPTLVIFRVLQGLGAGALQPTEQAILRQTFPPHEQGMAMAVFGMAVVLGPAFGPTLGGYIVDNYEWPWIFFINIPVGIVSLLMVTRFVHEPEDVRIANAKMAEQQKKNMDWIGIALLCIGLATLQYVLEEGNRNDWFNSTMITGLTFISIVTLIALVIRELSAPVPAADFSLFRDVVYLSGTLVGAVMFAMLMAVTFLLPLFMQTMLGFSATQAGMAMMPRSLVMIVCMPIVGRIYNKVSPRLVIAFGIILFGYSAWLMGHYTLATGMRDVLHVLVIQGVAFSCLFIPLTTLALARIPRHRLADATGLNSLLRQVGGSIGLAVFATLLSRYGTRAYGAMIGHVNAANPTAMSRWTAIGRVIGSRTADPGVAQSASAHVISGLLRRQAMMMSFEKLFYLSGICFLCVLPLVFLLRTVPTGEKIDVHVEM